MKTKKQLNKRKKRKALKNKQQTFISKISGSNKILTINNKSIEPKPKRLSKIARELNLSISDISKIIKNNINGGFDENPNTILSKEEINGLNEILQKREALDTKVIDYTWKLLEDLKKDYSLIFQITAEEFEKLVHEFLLQNGFTVKSNGVTNRKDGGIDLIAWKKDIINIVIAVQVKFKTKHKNLVTTGEVRDFKGALSINDYFTAGMVVTNTDFTPDARWIEEQLNSKLELKNYSDIENWLNKNFTTNKNIELNVNLGKDVYFNKSI